MNKLTSIVSLPGVERGIIQADFADGTYFTSAMAKLQGKRITITRSLAEGYEYDSEDEVWSFKAEWLQDIREVTVTPDAAAANQKALAGKTFIWVRNPNYPDDHCMVTRINQKGFVVVQEEEGATPSGRGTQCTNLSGRPIGLSGQDLSNVYRCNLSVISLLWNHA